MKPGCQTLCQFPLPTNLTVLWILPFSVREVFSFAETYVVRLYGLKPFFTFDRRASLNCLHKEHASREDKVLLGFYQSPLQLRLAARSAVLNEAIFEPCP